MCFPTYFENHSRYVFQENSDAVATDEEHDRNTRNQVSDKAVLASPNDKSIRSVVEQEGSETLFSWTRKWHLTYIYRPYVQ